MRTGRIALLDDGLDPASVAADDPAVAPGIRELRREHGETAAGGMRHQFFQCPRLHQRHVAVQHQHHVIRLHLRQREPDRVPRAPLLGLLNPGDGAAGKRLLHALAAVTVNDADLARLQRRGSVEDVLENRAPGERMQDLRQAGAHALALTRGEDDDGGWHGPGLYPPDAGTGLNVGGKEPDEGAGIDTTEPVAAKRNQGFQSTACCSR